MWFLFDRFPVQTLLSWPGTSSPIHLKFQEPTRYVSIPDTFKWLLDDCLEPNGPQLLFNSLPNDTNMVFIRRDNES